MMRKYYYERDDHDEFMKHCNVDCSNVEVLLDYIDDYKPTGDNMDQLEEDVHHFPYRCYVDTSDIPPRRADDMWATLSDDLIAAFEASDLIRYEVEKRLGVTQGTLLRYFENPQSMPLTHLMSLGDILNRRVVVNVLPLEG